MSLYGATCELSSIDHNGHATEDTTAGRYDPTYGIRAAVYANSGDSADWIGVNELDGAPFNSTFWHRGFWRTTGVSSGRTLQEYCDDTDTPVFRLQQTSANVIQAQYWDGDSWENVGSTYGLASNTLFKYDLKIVCGASFILYVTTNMSLEPEEVLSGSASMTEVANISRIRGYMNGNSGQMTRHSEWLWGDEQTIGHRISRATPTGDGTHTDGSGGFGDVDEDVTNDGDASTLAANGDSETYTHDAMTLPTGDVKAVFLEARVRMVAGGAENVKGRIRIGGTDYDQASNFAGIGETYGPYRPRWATNPAGGGWTQATASQVSNEFGLLAQT